MYIIKIVKSRIKRIWEMGGLHVIGGNFLNKFVVFFGSILIVRLLSTTEYGELSYIENLYNFLYLLAGIGLSNAILRFVILEEDIYGKRSVFNYMVKIAIIIDVIIVLIGFVANHYYPHADKFIVVSGLLYIMITMLPAQYFVDNNLTLERAFLDNKCFAYFNFAYAVIVIIGKCIGAYTGGVAGVVIVGVIIQYIFAIVIYGVNRKKYFPKEKKRISISKDKKKSIIVYSVQYMFTNGMWTLFMLIDIFLLGFFIKDPTIIADYKVAYAWPANISIVCSAVGMFVSPYFIKNESNREWVKINYRKVYTLNFLAVLLISLIICIAAKPLIFIYGGENYYNVIPLFRAILVSSFINNGLRYMTANCLAAMGKIRANMIVSFIGLIIQILLDLYFIPKFGAYGPAYSGIIVYTIMAIALFIVFNKNYNVFFLSGHIRGRRGK